MHPAESHAWFRAASMATLAAIHREAARAGDQWTVRLHDPGERSDIAILTPRPLDRAGAIYAATRAQVELSVICAVFPEEPQHVLRASWE